MVSESVDLLASSRSFLGCDDRVRFGLQHERLSGLGWVGCCVGAGHSSKQQYLLELECYKANRWYSGFPALKSIALQSSKVLRPWYYLNQVKI